MAVLNFSLNEEGVASLRDALICLNKFSDDVSLEARKDSVNFQTRCFIDIYKTQCSNMGADSLS